MKIREESEKGNSGNIPPIKRNEKIKAARSKSKKREDETKLNNFLSKEKKEKKSSSDNTDTSLEANSSQNPPPYIRKHKVGQNEEARASELDDIYFLCKYFVLLLLFFT